MNCLAWNCQGLGGTLTVQSLGSHIRDFNPQFIFLSETRSKGRKIDFLKNKFDLNGVSVDSRGKSGGLALFWRKDVNVVLQSLSINHIDVHILEDDNPTGWRLTGFYGEPDISKRKKSWDLLRRLSGMSNLPWVCIGDYNAILTHSDKEGRNLTPGYQLRDFRNALFDAGLSDIGFSGYRFTWSNGWEFPRTVKERLDRACISHSWLHKFPFSHVKHLKFGGSDHAPILLRILDQEPDRRHSRANRFMFESVWTEAAECTRVIENSWREGGLQNRGNRIWEKLDLCKKELEAWSSNSFGNILKRAKKLREKIHVLQTGVITTESKNQKHMLTMELEDILDKEEKMWQQRAKAHWMREGDRNTRYFHSRASGRKKKNKIKNLRKADGSLCKTDQELESAIVEYFKDIFTSTHPSESEMDVALSALRIRVSLEDNQYLLQPFSADEVHRALFSMYPLKSPGPDGFPPLFFQKYWSVVGNDVVIWVLDFLNNGNFDPNCNITNIALIPKCAEPELLSQFRPISLCNVVYKIASKTIANRLKPVMNSIISDSQSAFVPGRQITDNVLVAFETTHYMKNKTSGKVGQMAIKLDLSKAYDRVEWDFLRTVMIRLGFDLRFVNLIMTCVTSVTYSFILNGSQVSFVRPERGIRQGDPLSPYLFLFCAESLSALIYQEEMRGHLCGVAVSPNAPRISHLLFADDTLILCQATAEAAYCVQNILYSYGLASGQDINYDKSSVVFTRDTREEDIASILGYLPIRRELKHGKYLGLPLVVGRSKREVFDYIRERVWSRLQSLRVRSLSKAGKEVLIKSVIQAIPSYLMSCFKLPGYLIREINAMIANFWWDEKDVKKIHWVNWNLLCSSKRDGGLGFRDLNSFNSALLAKQAWRIITCPNNLLRRVLKAKYFPNCDFLEAPLGSNPSLTWRSIWGTKKILDSGLRWRVGDGNTIRIWKDSWLPRPHAFKICSHPHQVDLNSKVKILFDESTGSWNKELIENLFWESEAKSILSIPLGTRQGSDKVIWHFDRSGSYTVKSAYRLIRELKILALEAQSGGPSERSTRDWGWIWKLHVPPKVKLFVWSCCSKALPVRQLLLKRKVPTENTCPRCGLEIETVLHCLLYCTYARQVWALSNSPFAHYYLETEDTKAWFRFLCLKSDAKELGFAVILTWWLWFSRNKWVWESEDILPNILIGFAKDFSVRFQLALLCRTKLPMDRSVPRWSPPPEGFVKVNMDAAISKDGLTIGLGFIARDSLGHCLGWKATSLPLPLDPEAAEATAALRALEFSIASGWNRLILEGDCLPVVSRIRSPDSSMGVLGAIFDDIKRLALGLEEFRILHTIRENNRVAHYLAKLASQVFLFTSSIPSFIQDIVITEYFDH
ncbi:hypothetical protein ACJIZ3_013617 [Penstemon smallii]|uniref:Reverse transcriptase domain-containing protein n=1 Tax=Penstemon smallii TaxID=265156 RepID=A0ABD3RH40_9LAMI